MALKKISLENFKCFEKVDIDFGKITLLTGVNSSGKSSIIYSILGAIQSGEFPLQFSTNGGYVNMGSFEDIAFRRNKNSKIKLEFTFDYYDNSAITIKSLWVEDKVRKLPILKDLEISQKDFELIIRKKANKYLLSFKYQSQNNPDKMKSMEFSKKLDSAIKELLISGKTKQNKTFSKKFGNWEKKYKNLSGRATLSLKNLELGKKTINENSNYYLRSQFNLLIHFITTYTKALNYISSFRFHPERQKFETTKTDLKIGKFGENYENQIIYWETKDRMKFQELKRVLKRLNLLFDIKSRRSKGGLFEMMIKPENASVFSSLIDVGFGVSQFLPIIVADIQLGKNSTLFISQPEIHLHPTIQSNFGEYIIDQVNKANKKYIIETHSEYLLHKIRLLIVKGKIKPEDVKVHYFENNGIQTIRHKLTFTKDGKILNAPQSFFDTYMTNVMEIAINAAK